MIETNEPHLDLGEVQLATDHFFEVKIANTYMDPKVVIAQFSCGSCTHFVSGPDIVPPGREGIFKFRFTPTGLGEQVKSIFFTIDGNREATFLFKANVTP